MVCGADVILLGGLFWTVLGNRPVHAAAGNGTWVQEGGETLDRAKGLEGKCVALTFDDGPHEECTAQLLDGLKERGVRVTFFLMGQNIEGNEELVKRMHDEGHLIGNHSFHLLFHGFKFLIGQRRFLLLITLTGSRHIFKLFAFLISYLYLQLRGNGYNK